MPAYKVLCTKKVAPSLVRQAAEAGIELIEKEFIRITPVISGEKYQEIKSGADRGIGHIVFTSANAAAIFCGYLLTNKLAWTPSLKVFCLAGKTKDSLAPCFNEPDFAGTANNAEGLADNIIGQGIKKIIFCCGNKRRNELPDKLRRNGIAVNEVIIYETGEAPFAVPEGTGLDGILFFSPSAVISFFSVNKISPSTVCFAIGNTTATAIRSCTENRIITSDLPNEKILMNAVQFYFQNIK